MTDTNSVTGETKHVRAVDWAHRVAVELCILIRVSERPVSDRTLHRMMAAHLRDELTERETELIADLRLNEGL